MSITSPKTDFSLYCYKSPDARVWWYFIWKQNGRAKASPDSYATREAAREAMREAINVETRR